MSEAAFKGDVATMERLVSKGASVNQHDQVFRVFAMVARAWVCVLESDVALLEDAARGCTRGVMSKDPRET